LPQANVSDVDVWSVDFRPAGTVLVFVVAETVDEYGEPRPLVPVVRTWA
jgi:hypothetical protein